MAGYTEHEKIAEMAGIPSVISEEINRFMNDMNPPKEFEDHNTERIYQVLLSTSCFRKYLGK
jgi:hypothetical protein